MLPPPEPPELPDDVLGDILLRLPPDDPAFLLRASLYTLKYQLATRRLSVIQEPPPSVFRGQSIYPMTMEEVIEADSTREGPSSLDKLKMLMQRLLNLMDAVSTDKVFALESTIVGIVTRVQFKCTRLFV
ncbi:hypothetical protein EJB05_34133, partial [Eragrostis curvula]